MCRMGKVFFKFLCSIVFIQTSIDTLADDKAHKILERYCYTCHDEDTQKGNFQMDNLSKDLIDGDDADLWHLVLDQLNLHEMPPKKKKQPSEPDRQYVINYITDSLRKAAENKRQDVNVTLRRLTKQQYTNSLRDLLGLDVDFGKPLPAERFSKDGFKNNGEEQVISLLQTEYYQEIADKALDKTLPIKPPVSHRYNFTFGKKINIANYKKEKKQKRVKGRPIGEFDYITRTYTNRNPLEKGSDYERNDFYKRAYASTRGSKKGRYEMTKEGMLLKPSVPHRETYDENQAHAAFLSPSPNLQFQINQFPVSEGDFTLKVKVAKVGKGDAYVKAFMGERLDWGTDSKSFKESIKITKPENEFQTIEFSGRLENFPIPVFDPRHKDPDSTLVFGFLNDSGELSDTAIVIKEVEFTTNPKEFWPPKGYAKILVPSVNESNEEVYSKEVLRNFMSKAFRRDITSSELGEYHQLWKSLRSESDSFLESIKDTLSAVITSPKFLYMVEEKENSQ